MSRKISLVLAALLGLAACTTPLPEVPKPESDGLNLLVGTYTGTGSEGIYSYRFDQETGESSPLSVTPVPNPSFLTVTPDNKTVYAVTEQQADAAVSAFGYDPVTGKLSLKGRRSVSGKDPCHVTFTSGEVVVSNYSSGSMSIFPVTQERNLGEEILVGFSGSGPDKGRQAGSHIHSSQVTPDGKYLLVIDLGGDCIYRFPVEGGKVTSLEPEEIKVPAGQGPRHFTFSVDGRYLYLITELGGTVLVYDYSGGDLRLIQEVEADPLHARGSADIHFSPDGRFLYASNRLQGDGISIFRQDPSSGRLEYAGYQPTGIHPRNFAITPNGRFLLAACRDSDRIQVFRRDPETGLLDPTGKDIEVPHPVCAILTPKIPAPDLCPEPASIEVTSSGYHPLDKVSVACPDREAVRWAERHLKEWYGKLAPKVTVAEELPAAQEGDAYGLDTGKDGVTVSAGTLQGVRYALYSLRQIAIPARGTKTVEGWIVPEVRIKDSPEMDFRGIHICWFHETEPWEIERMVRLAAYYKMNYAVIESWGTFRSDVAPWCGWPDGTMTKKEVARIKAIADDLGITLIPQINVFGHATMARGATGKHAALDLNPEYQPLFEPTGGWNWCLSNPETRKLLQDLIAEQYEAFGRPPLFHIGGDEAMPPSCPDCLEHPFAELFLDHIKAMNETITSLGARTMMWHDMLLEQGDPRWKGFYANGSAETASGFLDFPRDIVICDWFYEGAKNAYPTLDYFKSQGFQVMTCPWKDWGGTVSQGRYAARAGLDGILGTVWHHNFGSDVINIFYPLANVAWNPGFSRAGNPTYLVYNHLRQVGWDMKVKDPRHTGIYYDEIPPEPFLNN